MHLVTDDSRLCLKLRDLEVLIAPGNRPPFNVSAEVVEQDVALVLGKATEIHDASDKPAWYLSRKMASQPLHPHGEVLVRLGNPVRLLAIVHDFDQDPSWNIEWVEQALSNIVPVIEDRQIPSLRLPVLGAQHGRVEYQEFLQCFIAVLLRQRPGCLRHIWLEVEEAHCNEVFHRLNEQIRHYEG